MMQINCITLIKVLKIYNETISKLEMMINLLHSRKLPTSKFYYI